MRTRLVTVALTVTKMTAAADNCFWRSNRQINAMDSPGWFACNNTEVRESGAQLCCIAGSTCGQDSICMKDAKYYVGGCTDGSYGDPVCRTSCSEFFMCSMSIFQEGCVDIRVRCLAKDGATWIQYNGNTEAWECCGDKGCDGSPPTETFSAIARASWSPIKTAPQSSFTSTETSSSQSTTSTTDASAAPAHTDTNDEESTTDNSGSGLSSGAKIGIGVACGLFGLAAILGVALILLRRYKKRRANTVHAYAVDTKDIPEPPSAPSAPSASQKNLVPGGMEDRQAQELMSQPSSELPAEATTRAELEGGFGDLVKRRPSS